MTSPKACDKPVKVSTTKAVFVGKVSCPAGAFLDERNGGECWKCPEDHLRTAAAVTAANACQTNLDFEPATKTAALTCPAGQHFDFIDGGTCWSCPQDTTRSLHGVKSDKACRIKKMRWVVPARGKYSLFGLGSRADDILAKLIAERTRIDEAAKAAAKVSGTSEAEAITNVWKVIDANPSESPVLSALLAQIVMETAIKPVQAALLPYRALQAAKKAAGAARVAGEVAKTAAVSGSWTGASAAVAAAAPIVVTMEMDKLLKTEEMEGKIRQAIDISNRPVDIGLLLQMKEGPDEFLFHWSAVIGGKTQPSANFKAKLAAYKSGKTPGDLSSIDPSKITITSTTAPGQPNPNTTTIDPNSIKIETIQSTSVVVGNPTAAPAPTAEKALVAAIKRQRAQPKGALRFELTNAPGLCLSKSEGPTEAMALADCNRQDTLWIKLDEKPNALVFSGRYCVGSGDAQPRDKTRVLISKCQTAPNMQWELQTDGHVKLLKADFCMAVIDAAVKGGEVLLQKCSADRVRQIWRPWAVAK